MHSIWHFLIRWFWFFLSLILGCLILCLIYVGFGLTQGASIDGFRISMDGIRLSSNLYILDNGNLIRSAQLTESELTEAVKKYQIKTIFNLQGNRPGYEWFDNEQKVAANLNVKNYNYDFASESIPNSDRFQSFMQNLANAERPILIHCRSGSDRTGEMTAVYMMKYMGTTKEQALEQLTQKYWHLSFLEPAPRYFIESVYKNTDDFLKTYNNCDPNLLYADRANCDDINSAR